MHTISFGRRLAFTILIITAFLFSVTVVSAAPPTVQPKTPSNAKRGKIFVPWNKKNKKVRKRVRNQRQERTRDIKRAKNARNVRTRKSADDNVNKTPRSPRVAPAPTAPPRGTVPTKDSRSVKSRKNVRSKRALPRKGQLRPPAGPTDKGPVRVPPNAPVLPGK